MFLFLQLYEKNKGPTVWIRTEGPVQTTEFKDQVRP